MSQDPFGGVLDPFAYFDISHVYDKYYGLFDLLVYCSVFIALCHVIFTRRFTGRPGKAMATAIGLALGISLTLAEDQVGWNLRQAGPIAIFIVLVLVGFLILHVLLRVHVSWKLAAPLTYILIYLFVRAMSPALFAAMAQRVPFVNLVSAIVFLIAVWQFGVAVWPKGHGASGNIGHDTGFVASLDQQHEKRETRVEKRIKSKLTPQAQRETVRLEHSLQSLQRALKQGDPDWTAMAQSLSGIAHRADDVIRIVDKIRVLDRRLRNFDWHELQELSSYCREMSDNDREQLKEQIQFERRKIVQEHTIIQLTERCERRHQEFRALLNQAAKACSREDRSSVSHHISSAAEIEEQQKADMKRLRQAEKRLLNLTRLKLKKEKS